VQSWGGPRGCSDERKKILERVAWRNHDDDAEAGAAEILLKLDILIGREQDLEALRSRTTEKFAVRNARPTLLLHSNDVMPGQLACELTRKLLIEKDAHRRSEPRAQPREQRWLALAKRTETRREIRPGYGRVPGSR
jgi:hypothetical protein